MSEHELSMDELVAQEAIELPAREMMQAILSGNNIAIVGALNVAAAVNLASPAATATATANQTVAVFQNSGVIATP
jgi:hypothetical protein